GNELFEDLGKNLVLAQNLMHRGALFVAQLAELLRFFNHLRVGGDLQIVRGAQVVRDVLDQQRDVIEQLRGRKDGVDVYRQKTIEPRQPVRGQGMALVIHARGDTLGVAGTHGTVHRSPVSDGESAPREVGGEGAS